MGKIKEYIVKRKNKKIYFERIVGEWLEYKKILIKKSTYSNYIYIIEKYLMPKFNEMSIIELGNYNYSGFIEDMLKKLSSKYVKDIVCVLRMILKYAEKKYKFELDFEKIIIPKNDFNELEILSKSEKEKLEQYCITINTLKSVGILICLNTGLRIGEICALKWENIDLENKVIYVRKTLQRVYTEKRKNTKIIIDTAKSSKSIRNIPISNKLYKVLKLLKEKYKSDDYFLTGKSNKYVEPRSLRRIYKRILIKTEIKEYTFHALRHTFATECIEVGMDVKSLSEILGHSSTTFTLDRYVHSSYKKKKKYLEKL